MHDSLKQPGQAGTEKMERLRCELAEKLALWEGNSLVPKEFANDLIRTVMLYYPNGLDSEHEKVELKL